MAIPAFFPWPFTLVCTVWLSACRSPVIVTTWKPPIENISLHKKSKLLVFCLVSDSSTEIRDKVETAMATAFSVRGYHALSALQRYGNRALVQMSREELFRSLCLEGIDGVVTLALIDTHKEALAAPPRNSAYPASYLFDRIGNYSNILVDITDTRPHAAMSAYWEAVVFDLSLLEPAGVVRTRRLYTPSAIGMYRELSALIIKQLKKEKIIER